jgi:hypothetical protein
MSNIGARDNLASPIEHAACLAFFFVVWGIADLFSPSLVLKATGCCDSLKQSPKWSFGD